MPQFELAWKPAVQSNETLLSNSKTFTVPANTYWQILSVFASVSTTSTAGSRQIVVEALNPSNTIICRKVASVSQPASTNYNYSFSPTEYESLSTRTASIFEHLTNALPLISLPPEYKLRVRDIVNIANDNVLVYINLQSATIA